MNGVNFRGVENQVISRQKKSSKLIPGRKGALTCQFEGARLEIWGGYFIDRDMVTIYECPICGCMYEVKER